MTRKARVGLVLSPEEKQMLVELAAAERLGISAMVRRLILLASQEVRSPSDQLLWMLRQELLRRGLVEIGSTAPEDQDILHCTPSEVET